MKRPVILLILLVTLVISVLMLQAQTPVSIPAEANSSAEPVGTYVLHDGHLLGQPMTYRLNTVTGEVWLIASANGQDGKPKLFIAEIEDTPKLQKLRAEEEAREKEIRAMLDRIKKDMPSLLGQ